MRCSSQLTNTLAVFVRYTLELSPFGIVTFLSHLNFPLYRSQHTTDLETLHRDLAKCARRVCYKRFNILYLLSSRVAARDCFCLTYIVTHYLKFAVAVCFWCAAFLQDLCAKFLDLWYCLIYKLEIADARLSNSRSRREDHSW